MCGIQTTKFYIKIQKTIFNEKFPIICEENEGNKNFLHNFSEKGLPKKEEKLKTTIFVKTKVCHLISKYNDIEHMC